MKESSAHRPQGRTPEDRTASDQLATPIPECSKKPLKATYIQRASHCHLLMGLTPPLHPSCCLFQIPYDRFDLLHIVCRSFSLLHRHTGFKLLG